MEPSDLELVSGGIAHPIELSCGYVIPDLDFDKIL